MPLLYVVATPIGNLSDMTPRAIEILKTCDLIAAEDTRVTMKLCHVFDIHTPLTSCHQHNEEEKGARLAEQMLAENLTVALTTDAGTPCVSDPGYGLVRACIERGMDVIPVPGCCAAVAALSVSGFDTREFAFYGFLPREKKDLKEKLKEIAAGTNIAVVHESPFRVVELVETIAAVLPETMLSVSCDLTKLHEKTIRGPVGEVLSRLRENPKTEKGEYCLVLDFSAVPALPDKNASEAVAVPDEAQLVMLMTEGKSLREAQEQLIAEGKPKNRIKQAALHLRKMFEQ